MLNQLIHNGILVPEIPLPSRLEIAIRGGRRELSPRQTEMAMAWAKKQGTPYVEDSVFVRNFMQDFSAALSINPPLTVDEVDFGPATRIVEAERAARKALTVCRDGTYHAATKATSRSARARGPAAGAAGAASALSRRPVTQWREYERQWTRR